MSLFNLLSFIANHPLNRQRKMSALLGFVKWQIGSRLVPGAVAFQWINNAMLVVRRGESGLTQNIYCGLAEFTDMAYLLHILTPDDLFVDVGANVGSYTILASAVKGARTIAIEPIPATYKSLMQNIRLNSGIRVMPLNIGLASEEGELSFTTGEDCMNHVATESDNGKPITCVPVRSLDSVLQEESPSLIKIDVEGFESQVIAGAHLTFANPALHSVIMESGLESRYHVKDQDIIGTMESFGFSRYTYEPFSRQLVAIRAGETKGGNTLFLRNESFIRTRLAKADRLTIKGQVL